MRIVDQDGSVIDTGTHPYEITRCGGRLQLTLLGSQVPTQTLWVGGEKAAEAALKIVGLLLRSPAVTCVDLLNIPGDLEWPAEPKPVGQARDPRDSTPHFRTTDTPYLKDAAVREFRSATTQPGFEVGHINPAPVTTGRVSTAHASATTRPSYEVGSGRDD